MVYSFTLLFTISLCSIISISECKVCKLDDVNCTTRAISSPNSAFVTSIANAVSKSDPLSLNLVKGYLPSVKYLLHNATFKGLTTCAVKQLQLNPEKRSYLYNLDCPYIELNAMYIMKGLVGNFAVTGEGHLQVLCDDYVLNFECDYELNTDKDNKSHIYIKNYLLDATPRGKIKFEFENLSAGDKEKTDALQNFVGENWKLIDKELRSPVLNAFIDLFVENFNSVLEKNSVDELLADLFK